MVPGEVAGGVEAAGAPPELGGLDTRLGYSGVGVSIADELAREY